LKSNKRKGVLKIKEKDKPKPKRQILEDRAFKILSKKIEQQSK